MQAAWPSKLWLHIDFSCPSVSRWMCVYYSAAHTVFSSIPETEWATRFQANIRERVVSTYWIYNQVHVHSRILLSTKVESLFRGNSCIIHTSCVYLFTQTSTGVWTYHMNHSVHSYVCSYEASICKEWSTRFRALLAWPCCSSFGLSHCMCQNFNGIQWPEHFSQSVNTKIDLDPILAFPCVAFMGLITKFWPETRNFMFANSTRHNIRVLRRIVNRPLVCTDYAFEIMCSTVDYGNRKWYWMITMQTNRPYPCRSSWCWLSTTPTTQQLQMSTGLLFKVPDVSSAIESL